MFCRRWGVPLIDGGTVRLPRIIGQGPALDLILTGRAVDADEALRLGLATRVVPSGTAREAAVALATELAALPQVCLRNDRASVYAQWDLGLTDALRRETELGIDTLRAPGALDGAVPLRRRRRPPRHPRVLTSSFWRRSTAHVTGERRQNRTSAGR